VTQIRHRDRRQRDLGTAVLRSAGSLLRLGAVVNREHAVQDRNPGIEGGSLQPVGRDLGDQPEVLGLAFDQHAEREHSVESSRRGEPAGRERQLERARHPYQFQIVVLRAASAQHGGRRRHQALHELGIEP
jgi:hypothetical protein